MAGQWKPAAGTGSSASGSLMRLKELKELKESVLFDAWRTAGSSESLYFSAGSPALPKKVGCPVLSHPQISKYMVD